MSDAAGSGARSKSPAAPSAEPTPRLVMTPDVLHLATYDLQPPGADEHAPVVLAVHGFASSFVANYVRTGWARDLLRAGVRVIGVDQRGHGASDKPYDAAAYSIGHLAGDLLTVLDTYVVNQVAYVGYSLGARVGWHACTEMPERITRAVLGGIPDGGPLKRFRTDEARRALDTGTPPADPVTAGYLTMADAVPGNDVRALVALVEGLRDDDLRPDPEHPPQLPILFATGSDDGIIEGSRRLAAAVPDSQFYEIPGRHHFNAPVSRDFRRAAIDFLLE